METQADSSPQSILHEADMTRPDEEAVSGEAVPSAPLSPISRSSSAAPPQAQETVQPSGLVAPSDVPTADGELGATLDATSAEAVGPLDGQLEQQTVQADMSEILAPSQDRQEEAVTDVQLGQQDTQNLATNQIAVTAQVAVEVPAAGALAEPTPHSEESAGTADTAAESQPDTAVQAIHDEPTVSGQGQEHEAEAPFANATFVVPTENWKHLQTVPLATTAAEIKHSLCSNWNITESALSVKYNRQELQDNQSLASCGIQPGQDVDIELVIHYQKLSSLHKHRAEPAKVARLPEKFEVHVLEGSEAQVRTVTVVIDVSQKQGKVYKGGYKDKRNGTLYHHADCQTDRQSVGGPKAKRAERECQTVEVKQRSAQTCREAHVQMARPDLLLDTSRDKLLVARPYVSADEVWAVKEKCAATIQRFTRGWLARKRVSFMLKEARQGSAAANRAAAQTAEQEAAHRRREAERRLQPRTSADFALLHSELEAWRLAETARIKGANLSPEDCHQALAHLLHQETKLLQSIDRLRGEADVVKREQRVAEALALMAHPKAWPLSNGALLEVHTPATTKASELRGLYRGLQLQGLAAGERLDVLLHVKFRAKEFDCSLTRELVQLIDREADLINRGRKAGSMEGLRKRISTLFLQFIENPMFNPEAANFFNLGVKTCSTENYMYTGMTANDSATLAAKSLLV